MTAEQQNDKLSALYQTAFPASAPSDTLRQRILEMTSQAESAAPALAVLRASRTRQLRIGLALAGACVVILAFFALKPRIAGAAIYYGMQHAIHDARSAHITAWDIQPDGTRKKVSETWFDAGRWRTQNYGANPRVEIVAGGEDWAYDPTMNQVELRHHMTEPQYTDMSGFTLASMESDATLTGKKLSIQTLGDATVGGYAVHRIEISGYNPGERIETVVDAETDFPISAQVQRRQPNGQWVTFAVSEAEFNQPVDAALFKPAFPKSAQVVDVDHAKAQWQARLAKGVESKSFGESHISYQPTYYQGKPLYYQGRLEESMQPTPGPLMVTIRDLEVNQEGDVFVLYTTDQDVNNHGFWDGAQITDSLGTTYLVAGGTASEGQGDQEGLASFIPTVLEGGNKVNGYVYDGHMLEGAWFVPLVKQGTWRPRMFNITIHDYEQTFSEDSFGKALANIPFTRYVAKPACHDVPGWMPYMARSIPGPLDSPMLLRTRHYMNGLDWQNALSACDDLLAYDRAEDDKGRQQSFECDSWYLQYEILSSLGRTDDARKALLKARDTEVYEIDKSEIDTALKKEGLAP